MKVELLVWSSFVGSVIAVLATLPSTAFNAASYPLHPTTRDLGKRQSTEQLDETRQKNYQATLTLGHGQQFNVLVDTGSTDLFLPASGAGPGNTVQSDPSVVQYPGSPSCSEAYGGVDTGIEGDVYTAPFTFAGTTTDAGSPFCLVMKEGSYAAAPDGVLGLQRCVGGPKGVAGQTGGCPLGSLGWSSFGIYLSSDDQNGGGFITPNDVNGDLYSGDFAWEPLIGNTAHWTFSLGDSQWSVDGYQDNLVNKYAFVDTGNPTINVDPDSAEKIWASVGARPGDGVMGCDLKGSAPDIVFTFGSGSQYSIPSSVYVVESPITPGVCRCGVIKQQTTGVAVLGAIFVKAYYTFFDNGEGYIGFAPSIG